MNPQNASRTAVVASLSRLLRDLDLAEDLAQEAWVGIMPILESYDPERNDSIGGFVAKRCFGAIVDRQRRRVLIKPGSGQEVVQDDELANVVHSGGG